MPEFHKPYNPAPGQYSGGPQPSPAHKNHAGQPQKEGWTSILSFAAILSAAVLFALFLITFVFQSYLVDGPSMETTLYNNERLIVWKVPRSLARITGNPYIPDRGDIIVFTEPGLEEFGQKSDKQLIKRVVALPGEQVVVKDGAVTVYNSEHPEGFHPDQTDEEGTISDTTNGMVNVTVPENHVFVLGDNRGNSLDSRAFGPVSADNIVGKLTARFLPLSEAQRF